MRGQIWTAQKNLKSVTVYGNNSTCVEKWDRSAIDTLTTPRLIGCITREIESKVCCWHDSIEWTVKG